MDAPLVTVICLCFNHERFVREAIASVLRQSYSPVQLVIVDDASTDGSVSVVRSVITDCPDAIFLPLETNLGNCRAFNRGLALAGGKFIIDLAADDQLMPNRIEKGVKALESAGQDCGVNFSDAELINEDGKILGLHSERFPHNTIPQGNIYIDVILRYFINSPTMMIRREVFDALGGYDESLAYEDFDFWVRSSRKFRYCYTPMPLVRRRMVANSMAKVQYRKNSLQLISTFRVCEKIAQLNEIPGESKALKKRIMYEMKRALGVGAWGLSIQYLKLLFRT